jgi:hypothetical protein
MRRFPLPCLLAIGCAISIARADVSTFTAVNSGLDAVFGNAGKGVLDPQVAGVSGVAFGNDTFVVVGASSGETVIRWATSPDGVTWTPHSQTIADGAKSSGQSKVHFLNNKFVFFATHALTNGSGATYIYTSADGQGWTGAKILDGAHNIVEFAANPNRIMACGTNGDQFTSLVDLVTWTSVPVVAGGGTYSHNDIAYGAGRFISTINGFGGQTYSSTDGGTTWTALTGLAAPGGGVVEAGNDVVLVNFGADYYRSTDGATFTKVAPILPNNLWVLGGGPRFVGGRFIALSYDFNTGNQTYLGSTDGLTWTPVAIAPPAPTPPAGTSRGYTYIDYAWGNGKYVLVAADTTQTFFTKTVVPAIFTATVAAGSSGSGSGTSTPTQATVGGSVTLGATGTGTIQWQHNGANVSSATSASLSLANFQPADAGIYSALVTSGGSTTTQSFVVGVSSTQKVVGTGEELQPANIPHPNGNIFDQVLLKGVAATITADAGQATRMSFVDLTNDIVQVEFSGAGTLSVVLDGSSGPAQPVNYNQPSVAYMKGHAGIVITGANETTNLLVFTVGRATAFDPTGGYNILAAPGPTNNPANNGSSLFQGHAATVYDGTADLAFVAIASTNGKFGALRTANASYFATKGFTGIYAPGVQFSGPVYAGDINASDAASPVFIIGSSSDTRITGGDLLQSNGQAVQVAGLTQLKFTNGSDSHGNTLAAKANQGVLKQNGTDVTASVVVNP